IPLTAAIGGVEERAVAGARPRVLTAGRGHADGHGLSRHHALPCARAVVALDMSVAADAPVRRSRTLLLHGVSSTVAYQSLGEVGREVGVVGLNQGCRRRNFNRSLWRWGGRGRCRLRFTRRNSLRYCATAQCR